MFIEVLLIPVTRAQQKRYAIMGSRQNKPISARPQPHCGVAAESVGKDHCIEILVEVLMITVGVLPRVDPVDL